MKRFLAIIATLIFGFSTVATTSTAFADEATFDSKSETNTKSVDYTHYKFPDDATILYQSEDGVVYQSKEETTSEEPSTYATYQNSVTIPAGKIITGNFSITNPHTIIFTTKGVFRVESSYSSASAQMILSDGINVLANKNVSASAGDVHFEFNSHVKDLVVIYYVQKTSSTAGMTLRCTLS